MVAFTEDKVSGLCLRLLHVMLPRHIADREESGLFTDRERPHETLKVSQLDKARLAARRISDADLAALREAGLINKDGILDNNEIFNRASTYENNAWQAMSRWGV